MDYPRDIKIMVLLLGFLAVACSAKQHAKVPDPGYTYNRGQGLNSHNKILKAVLVHESTGQGLHSGSVSGSKGNFKVTQQSGDRANSGYSYPARQIPKPNLGAADTTIRVFHESTGNTGNIVRTSSPPPHPQKRPSIIKQNPSHTLRYIHENALSRSRSDHNFIERSQGLPSGNGGYQYDISQNLRNIGYQSETSGNVVNTGSVPSGYQYQSPIQVSNSNDNGINPLQAAIVSISKAQTVSLTGTGPSGSNGYQYASPVQAVNINQGNENSYLRSSESNSAHAASSGYQYQNQGIVTSNAFGSISNENQQNTFTSPNQAAVLSNSAGIVSNGYQYRPPFQPQPIPNQAQTINQGSSGYESAHTGNGYQYPNKGFGTENFPTSSQTQSANLQHIAPGSGQTILNINGDYGTNPQSGRNLELDNSGIIANEGYRCGDQGAVPQYSSPALSSGNQVNLNIGTQGGYQYSQGVQQNENFRTDGYQYQKPNENVGYQDSQSGQIQSSGQSANAGYPFNGFVQALKSNHHSEQPREEGYRYEQSDAAKSVFKGQPYLPLPPAPQYSSPQPDGYRYDKPDESSRSHTTFKGQPYLPLPPVSGGR